MASTFLSCLRVFMFRVPQLLTCLVRNEGKLILNLLSKIGSIYPQAIYFPIRTLYLTLKIEQRERCNVLSVLILVLYFMQSDIIQCLYSLILASVSQHKGSNVSSLWSRVVKKR